MADLTINGSSSNNNASNELQQIYQIISDRSEGKATNEDVESAVSRLLAKEKTTIAAAAAAAATQGATNSSNNNHHTVRLSSTTSPANPPDESYPPTTNSATAAKKRSPSSIAVAARKPPPAVRLAAAAAAAKSKEDEEFVIEEDLEDYDNLDVDADEKPSSSFQLQPTKQPPPAPKRGRPRKHHDNKLPEPDWSLYSDIPLGKEGAKMMTTFGDCRLGSDPAAVAATLLGARRMLQAVIYDARHLRRKYRTLYKHAKKSVRGEHAQQQTVQQQGEWTAELLYKALQGRDSQSSAPPCGFGIEELQQLCPEEMNAYRRWNEMHEAAAVDDEEDEKQQAEKVAAAAAAVKTNKEDDNDNDSDDNDDDDDDDKNGGKKKKKKDRSSTIDMALAEGHLQERAEQFDLRTDRMEKAWYLQFSNIRKGSFLTRRGRGPAAATSAASTTGSSYDDNPDDKRVGRPPAAVGGGGGWATMPKTHVRFLHWVGFDPQSALPPPNKDTTHVLAFLAHDFFGRIVEKAILLRNQQKQKMDNDDKVKGGILVLNELQAGERLSKADIDRAMQDPDIKPQPIYSSSASSGNGSNNAVVGTQLYFGPGFEERLELEMEEIVQAWSKKKKKDLPEEELQIRQEEEALFEKLSAPPTLEGAKLLAADPNCNAPEEDLDDAKPAAVNKTDNASASVDTNKSDKKPPPPTEPKKRRGIPPKKKKTDEDSTNQQSPEPQKKKRRGRPPSAKKESSEAIADNKAESEDDKKSAPAPAPAAAPEPKKRRGRPTTKKESVVASDKDVSVNKKQPPARTKSQTADKKSAARAASIDSKESETKVQQPEPKKRKAEETPPSRRSTRIRSR